MRRDGLVIEEPKRVYSLFIESEPESTSLFGNKHMTISTAFNGLESIGNNARRVANQSFYASQSEPKHSIVPTRSIW